MKKLYMVVLALSFILIYSTTVLAGNESNKKSKHAISSVEDNLLKGLGSGNCGLKMSCAYFLGEMKSSKAVIPLMKMLRDETNECNRLMAALALTKIGDPRGIYMVKRRAVFDSSLRVRSMCERFYKAYRSNDIQLSNPNSVERYALSN